MDKFLLDLLPVFAPDAPVNRDNGLRATNKGLDAVAQVTEGVTVLSKDDEFAPAALTVK